MSTGCSSFIPTYRDFFNSVVHSAPAVVNGARSIEVAIKAANGANRLFVFTGIASVNVQGPLTENNISRGVFQIILDAVTLDPGAQTPQGRFADFNLTSLATYIDGNAYAGLAGFLNSGKDVQTTYAIDCVSVEPMWVILNNQTRLLPVIQLFVASQGVAGTTLFTSLTRVAYQANLQLNVGLNLQVAPPVGGFGPAVTINAGDTWLGQITLPTPAPPTGLIAQLTALVQDSHVPVQHTVPIPPNSTSAVFSAPTGKFGPPDVSVPIVAAVNGISSPTATVHVKAKP
jgi:hypothetical protein